MGTHLNLNQGATALFGNGSDGDHTLTGDEAITTAKQYANLTVPAGKTLTLGTDDLEDWPTLRVRGILTVPGTVRAALRPIGGIGHANYRADGGAEQAAAANGNPGQAQGYQRPRARAGRGGGSGAGGGDAVHNGGNGKFARADQYDQDLFGVSSADVQSRTGDTTAGDNGMASQALATTTLLLSYGSAPRLPGNEGHGGGGGACGTVGAGNVGGKGGDAGRGGGIVDVRARHIVVASGGIIHADGEVGEAGAKGVATNAGGDISGGGAGGGGGGGGTVVLGYETLTDGGTIRSAAGPGGTGGAGEVFDDTPNATYNGGNGAAGTAGILIKDNIL